MASVPATRRLALGRAVARAPGETFFVGSAVFHYLGPAFAVLLFARLDVLGVAWLRIGSAALIFALWRRPWRSFARLDRPGWLLLLGLGAVLATMNSVFYEAIDSLPLGTVAAAFADPVALAAGVGVGLSSSVVPYVCDQLAMRRMSRSTYSLLLALLPATATVVGLVVLAQAPSAAELTGVGLVILAVAAHRDAEVAEPY